MTVPATTDYVPWRDELLDALVRTLRKNKDNVPLADRLAHYLRDARAIEASEGVGGIYRLAKWTAERLPEIEHRQPGSSLIDLRDWWLGLALEFRTIRKEDAAEGRVRRPADWLPIIEADEQRLRDKSLAVRDLTRAQRDEVIATSRGTIRQPSAMALYLLWHACRPRGEDLALFRRQLDRVPYRPRAL